MFLARSYSHYSLLSAVPKIPDLIKNAKLKGYTSICLADEDTTSGLIEFYQACKKNDIKCTVGTTLRIPNIQKTNDQFGRNNGFGKISVLAKNNQGYKAILEIVTTARTINEDPDYHIKLEDLKKYKNNSFYVTLNGLDHEYGSLALSQKKSVFDKIIKKYIEIIGKENLILELLQKRFDDDDKEIKKANDLIYNYCLENQIKCIVSPGARYLDDDDREAFQVILAIKKQVRIYDITLERDFNLPSVDELKSRFSDYPEALNTEDIESNIDLEIRHDYDKKASEAFFPHVELPQGQTPAESLTWEVYIGLLSHFDIDKKSKNEWKAKFPFEKLSELKKAALNIDPTGIPNYPKDYWKKKKISDYIERIEYELDIILTKGYPSYFLVFADIMRFCRDNDIVINTRGSAAGSLIGFLTGINILDPLIYNLPFERFLNPFRPSAPDIDGDFADDRREEVIQYLVQKYGRDNVCQIVTFGTMLPRAAVRDIGRVLGVAYRKCDQLSKLIPTAPQGRKTTFEWAFETSKELTQVYETDSEVKRIIDIAKKIEANHRHASVHAAGVVITPTKLTDYCALQWDSDHKQTACQYDMRVGEQVGLVKMDILGITNLSILGNAVKLTEKRRNKKVDLYHLPLKDQKTFNLLASGKTMGLFQLSGPAMTKYLVELEPTKVQDLMAMVALYRPGAMANIPDYIKRKKDESLVEYLVPQMKEFMGESYGLFVYQEDLLYTATELAGYNWGDVDVLRKGMGKKIQSVIDAQHPIFVEGAIKHSNIPREKAEEIWDLMVPFGAYGFNKSHSTNYGMVAYMTAYMKANFPAEFMTSLMTSVEGNMDKIASAINECREMEIDILPPDVNQSYSSYTIIDDKTIRYGFGAVKNLGSDVVDFIIQNREQEGEYKDVSDFLNRMSKQGNFNKRSLEALIHSGSLDELYQKEIS